jgi:peptidoglycan/xylan/chitin deacetylase (PgdA/CDA1 family)
VSKGIFTISLDFELHWGGFEKWPLDKYRQYFLNTRDIIPAMLKLFEQHEVHVTWATVGMLLHDSRQSLLTNAPRLKPSYEQQQLSAYHFIDSTGIGNNEGEDPFHFAPSLVKQIVATPHQELGTHTFAHYYCNEAGQTLEQFQDDLRAAKRIAATYGVELRSLVFPRNQFNDKYLKACYEEGISSVRSNPLDWFWKIDSTHSESMWKRVNRGADAYLPVGKKNTYLLRSLPVSKGLPLCIPASRLLRPYNPKEFFLNAMKIDRIKTEMSRAAERGEVYHLWWHPHNFGSYPEQSIAALREILSHYSACNHKWSMVSATMHELTQQRLNER